MKNIDISKLSINDDAKNILTCLLQRYKTLSISKKELARELGVSNGSIDNYILRNYGIPKYKKLGISKNAKVVFNLIDVAVFLADKGSVK